MENAIKGPSRGTGKRRGGEGGKVSQNTADFRFVNRLGDARLVEVLVLEISTAPLQGDTFSVSPFALIMVRGVLVGDTLAAGSW